MLVNFLYVLIVVIKKIVVNDIYILEILKIFGIKKKVRKNYSIFIRVLINNDYKYFNKKKEGLE